MKICPVVLAGGSGTRLWPFSRTSYPKQFLDNLFSQSLFTEVLLRISELPFDIIPPLIVCNEEHQFLALNDINALNLEISKIILEPEGNNTAPACTLAAIYLDENFDEEVLMLVLPADQKIGSKKELYRCINSLKPYAEKGSLCTLGINPTSPHTGYGYLQVSDKKKKNGISKLIGFHEKPTRDRALDFLSSGDYFWNSGIFLFSSHTFLSSLDKSKPSILSSCKEIFTSKKEDNHFLFFNKEEFLEIPSDSIDYAVMEKSFEFGIPMYMASLDTEWSDLGSWSSIHQALNKDKHGNASEGDVISIDTKNSLLISGNALLSTIGLEDMVVINTSDALLVASLDSEDKVKDLTELMKESNRSELQYHKKVYRPWGNFTVIEESKNYKVKNIQVNPYSSLSLQRHKFRSEHWVVVSGKALVTKNEEELELEENESIFIPANTIHSLKNKYDEALNIIEVQTGSYLGEDDIERLKDDYGRTQSD
tara:strand:+ start:40531 stop:41973 length:1443 start_codon:yes stop_codon:yes gene_type:complete